MRRRSGFDPLRAVSLLARLLWQMSESRIRVHEDRRVERKTGAHQSSSVRLPLPCPDLWAALRFKSLAKLQQVDAGSESTVITLSEDIPSAAYPTPESAFQFYEAVVATAPFVPGWSRISLSRLALQGREVGRVDQPG